MSYDDEPKCAVCKRENVRWKYYECPDATKQNRYICTHAISWSKEKDRDRAWDMIEKAETHDISMHKCSFRDPDDQNKMRHGIYLEPVTLHLEEQIKNGKIDGLFWHQEDFRVCEECATKCKCCGKKKKILCPVCKAKLIKIEK